jgi:aryl-alcohol dehydrogenase-like predicted oxidoreductase
MELRPLGKTGLQVSVLGFGGAELGFDSGVTEARQQ